MAGVLKVGEPQVSIYRNMVTNPVPFASGQITYNWYTPNPDPAATISYLLDQVDGATTNVYGQYLEDYARITVPLVGAGTEADPYRFYPYPVLGRRRANFTAADFVGKPFLNTVYYYRIPQGTMTRAFAFWYSSANLLLHQSVSAYTESASSSWRQRATAFPVPPQSVLNNVAYVLFGIDVDGATMTPAQNFWDMTGFRASAMAEGNVQDIRGVYWDGSTVFPATNYVPVWDGTPRSSTTTLTVTELASVTVQTENFRNLSIDEDVTGLDAAAITGGTAQASVTVPYEPDSPTYLGLAAEMQETALGNYFGRVRDFTEDEADGSAELTLDESLSLLNAWVVAQPQSGTLSSVIRTWSALSDAPVRPFVFEDSTDLIPVNVPGFAGNLYDKIRELLAANNTELVTINGVHIVRSPLKDQVILDNFSETTKVRSNLQETAKYVRVHWYDNEYMSNQQVFPVARNPQEPEADAPEPTVYSVGAGQTLTVDIQLRASLFTVNNPNYVAFVPDEDVAGQGVYTAVGSDNLPVTPSQWAAGKGSLTVKIKEDDPSVIQVTIRGADFPNLAPFRIAMSSGSGNYYNALRITGTGVFIRDQYVDLPTGALPSATGQEFAVECTNPFIATRTQAYQAGQVIAGRIRQAQSFTGSVPTPNDPSTPVLGMLPGAKFVYGNQQFRVESTTVGLDTVSINATYALTSADFDRYFGGGIPFTSGDFDALYDGASLDAMNFSLKPLLHRLSEV